MRFRIVSAVALLSAVPAISPALGLGDETVRSFLNAPLNAEIELFANSDELTQVRAQLASRDDFVRHGLDYPGFLSNIQLRIERLADGRNVIRLTTAQALVEPFVVVLLDVRTDGSRLLREYTLLLDPPTFQTTQPAAPIAVAPPAAGTGIGNPIRPVQPPPPVAAPPPPQVSQAPVQAPRPVQPVDSAPPRAPTGGGGQYTVRRGDTLSLIAGREYGASNVPKALIAIFRANPQAFDGNINRLRAGATLSLPDQGSVAAVSQSEASAEVRNQMSAWMASTTPGAENAEGRLRLVPPAGGEGSGTGSGAGTTPGTGPGATPAPDRPLTVDSPDLARVQQGQTPAGTPPAPGAETPATPGADVNVADLGVTEPAAPEAAPPAPAPEAPPVVAAPAAEATGPGLVDRIKEYWLWGLGALVVIAALLALLARRRRSDAVAAYAPITPSLDDFELPAERDISSNTFPLRRPTDGRDSSIVVEESGIHDRQERPTTRRDTPTVSLDPGGASQGGVAMEQGDPLAEADFHMAYGLYDQAADLVKAALKREPARRDLKLKLLEVFFVWGNKDQFLQTARELAKSRDGAAPGEWEKVVIMGKQLAPEDVIFHQTPAAAQTSVDLNLEGGQNLVDFNLQDDGSGLNGQPDMNHSGTFSSLKPMPESGLDFLFDDPARGDDRAPTATTRQMTQPLDTINAPTLEQPALDVEDSLAGKLDVHRGNSRPADQTAELAIDDLGLDLGRLDATGTGLMAPSFESMSAGDAPTLVGNLDQTARELLADADAEGTQRTEMLPLTDLDLSGLDAGLDIDFAEVNTARVPVLPAGSEVDLDVGLPDQGDGTGSQKTQRFDATIIDSGAAGSDLETTSDLEPVTMSEVGTKLDLARAYMDMGDPDGARSILNEVVQEGSESQRQEARRLLDSIPG